MNIKRRQLARALCELAFTQHAHTLALAVKVSPIVTPQPMPCPCGRHFDEADQILSRIANAP